MPATLKTPFRLQTRHLRYHAADMELTRLLEQARSGDARARDAVFAAAYPELQKLAHARLRDRARQKRGAGLRPLTLNTQIGGGIAAGDDDVLRIHDALGALEATDERLAQLVQMRYFGGYSEEEVADT